MAGPKYPRDLRERAVSLVLEAVSGILIFR